MSSRTRPQATPVAHVLPTPSPFPLGRGVFAHAAGSTKLGKTVLGSAMRPARWMAALSMLLHSSAISPAIAVEGAAPRRALQSACFAPAALQAIPGEQIAKKGDRSFSTPLSRKAPLISAAPVPDHLRGSIRSVALPPGLKLVALTTALCADNYEIASYEGRIFDTLRQENVNATSRARSNSMPSHEARPRP